MEEARKPRFGRVVGLFVACLVVVAIALGFFFKQDLGDMYRAAMFKPSPEVAEIAQRMDLTRTGERIFNATHPTLESSQRFTELCSAAGHAEGGHLLGCYADGQIRLFQVDDERIRGIVEVTGAHELLHAAYARLHSWERSALEQRLSDVYEELAADDPDLAERMSVYENLPRDRFLNEVHSVLGTEVADLPEDLEEHYAQWFKNRGQLVGWFDSFRGVFTGLTEEAESLSSRMDKLKSKIDKQSKRYAKGVEQFNSDVLDFNARNERYEFSGKPKKFARLRDELADRREDLEDESEALSGQIDRYNEMRDRLIELGQVGEELDQKLDANLAPVG